ncbi:MAG: hypothetical protein QG632_365 [Candidatus Dependentiae bacterium]|nr:hypothetical protein [Candidatus Dependentiae bacterium]
MFYMQFSWIASSLRFLLFFLVLLAGSAQASTAHFLAEQLDNPLNPVTSYNLGIAALEQKQYPAAERHFSLAVDLYDRQNNAIVPAYFCWADTAALQLFGMLKEQKELKDEALNTAIKRAVDASNRYGNVLVFDAEHEAARERKKIVDRLRALLEQRKNQQEEEKKQEQQNKQDKQENEDKKDKKDKPEQDRQDKSQDENQQGDGEQDQQQNDGQQSQDGKENKKNEKGADKNKQPGKDQQKQSCQEEQRQGTDEKEQPCSADKAEEEKTGNQEQGAGNREDEQKQQPAVGAADENVSSEAPAEGEEQMVAAAPQEYDANAEMVKKRALVLLDRLQQNEAALQKQQLLKKSAAQVGENKRYNQW